MTLTPAYGRDYKSGKEATAAFNSNVDFIIADFMHPNSGAYVNKEQLIGKETTVNIRFKRLTGICVVKVK